MGRNDLGFIKLNQWLHVLHLAAKQDPISEISALKLKIMVWLTLEKNYPIFKIGETKFIGGCGNT